MAGRPTIYKPEYSETLPDMMAKGESVCSVCKKWGISRRVFYKWLDEIPEFAEAYELAKTYCQAWWEETGRQGLYDKTFTDFDEDGKKVKTTTVHINDRVWARNMCARFSDWQEKKNLNITSTPSVVSMTPEEREKKIAEIIEKMRNKENGE